MKSINFINFSLFFLFFSLFLISNVFGEQIILFQMTPDNIPFYKENKILHLWNPKGHQEIQKPGLKLFFFGKAENCQPESQNGPVKFDIPDTKISKLTGLPINHKGKVFYPAPDKTFCFDTEKNKSWGSFIYLNDDPTNGGIGLLTASGIDEEGKSYFFQTRDAFGVGGGVNKFEKVTAFTWRIERSKISPFNNNKKIRIISKSSVESLPSLSIERDLPVQVRQQLEIGFANRECLKSKKGNKILCLNKYVFDFLVKRWGGKPLDEQRECLIFVDRGQAGLPHVACYSKPSGMNLKEKSTQLDVVTSCGEGLMQTTFKDKNFCYTINWAQFIHSLKAIASTHLNKPVAQITDRDLKNLFSEGYSKPEEWFITVVSFQQELHDPYKDRNVFIGGNIKEIKVLQE